MLPRIPAHRPPTHPGEMLREDFLLPLEMSAQELAERIHVASRTIECLVEGQGEITPDLALGLSRLFGTTPDFWLNGQLVWDLYHAMHAPEAADVETIVPLPLTAAEDS